MNPNAFDDAAPEDGAEMDPGTIDAVIQMLTSMQGGGGMEYGPDGSAQHEMAEGEGEGRACPTCGGSGKC